jgi:pre-mRNA-splicing factor 38B
MGKQVTIGAFVTDLVLSQNYFETIFIRIPKKITDEIVQYLKDQGLPHVPIGNGGQGGPDRRGGDDGRARPASVKVCRSSTSCHLSLRNGMIKHKISRPL